MDNIFSGKKDGQMYVGEVEVGMKEMHSAIEAAKRLLGEHVFSNVKLAGDKGQCEAFAKDVIQVATMFSLLTKALVDGKPMDLGEVN